MKMKEINKEYEFGLELENDFGVDTYDIQLRGRLDVKEVKGVGVMLDKTRRYIDSDGEWNTVIVCRANKISKGSDAVFSTEEAKKSAMLLYIDLYDRGELKFDEPPKIKRVDIASNLRCELRHQRNLMKTFLYALLFRRGTGTELYEIIKSDIKKKKINILGNYKIKCGTVQTTIYQKENCVRIENRKTDIKVKCGALEEFSIVQNKFLEELNGLGNELKRVEEFMSDALYEEFKYDIEEFDSELMEFLKWADKQGYLLTKNIFVNFLKKAYPKLNPDVILKAYRRKNKGKGIAKFVCKKDITSLCDLITDKLKKKI
ncbi:MAG: hypothetical protein ACRC5T_09785 [Cetobacterium sp.]